MADERQRRLLGVELESLAHLDADPTRIEEVRYDGVVLQVRASGVPERVTTSAVLLTEQTRERGPVLVGEAPLLTDPQVPVLSERLGELDSESVQMEILRVPVLGEQLRRLA